MDKDIKMNKIESFERAFSEKREHRIAMRAVAENGLKESAKNHTLLRAIPHQFSLKLEQGAVTNQKSSGRCWMFAALNVLRFDLIKKLNVEDLELSQSYTMFFDKLEKANWFLENILETLDEPTDGRLVQYLLSMPMNDGGQWDMMVNLIEKYGLVPKSAMPETHMSSNSRDMNACLTEKLRGWACRLREKHMQGISVKQLRAEKEEMLATVYRILCICLGEPPKQFDFSYTDKDKVFHKAEGLTPRTFYRQFIGADLSEYVSIINSPTEDKPFYRSYTVRFLGNVKEGRIVRYVNLPAEELKRAAVRQLEEGHPVWFGCDVGKASIRADGVMAVDAYRLDELLDTDFPMTKGQRLDYGQSLMTHAMVFQGVDLDESGAPTRWRVENSWGEDAGEKGYYVMTDDWFEEYMYQIVVHQKYLSDEALDAYWSEPIVLQPWDPMGSLAATD